MTLTDAVAQCKAQGLGMSACLDLLSANKVCSPGIPGGASQPDGSITYSCSAIPDAQKAAIELAEAEARAKANAPAGPPWLLIGGGVAAVALVAIVWGMHAQRIPAGSAQARRGQDRGGWAR